MPWVLVMTRNNVAYLNYQFDRPAEALATAQRMVETTRRFGLPLLAAHVDTMGRAMLAAGRPAEAIDVVTGWLDRHGGGTGPDEIAENLLALAEAQRVVGRSDAAHRTLDQCPTRCRESGLIAVRARVHEQRAETFAGQQRWREAFEEHKRFTAAAAAAGNRERGGQAKIAQAMFETAEARRDSERFRSLSLHEPLTGLVNRRFSDERLPRLLARVPDGTPPLLRRADARLYAAKTGGRDRVVAAA